ncbi:MAG: Energy-coupling factor transporter ATP-binding protein EcfA2 [candidate division WS2 bacterium]|nr:Energy-coupling factor transporter ATP-binding protein EcfA2 [Candidatus Psychracetigena formicireducens]
MLYQGGVSRSIVMGISVQNLTHIYNYKLPWEFKALDSISFSVEDGEGFAVLGGAGSGKSTLAQHVNGLLFPTSGKVIVNGTTVKPGVNLLELRKTVGMVFQYPEAQLFGETVFEEVAFGLRNLGFSEEVVESQVQEALNLVGFMPSAIRHRNPLLLSGGEKRKVALAGIIAMKSSILVLDEPTSGLDIRSKKEVLTFLKEYRKANKAIIIYITHSLEEALSICERGIILSEGKQVYQGDLPEYFIKNEDWKYLNIEPPINRGIALTLKEKGLKINDRIITRLELIKEIEKCFKTIKT